MASGRSMQRGGGVVRARGQGRGAGSQRGGRGRGRGGRYNGNAPTIEELDAQLDAYNSKVCIVVGLFISTCGTFLRIALLLHYASCSPALFLAVSAS